MIQSLLILNASGEVIIEKHWRGNARRDDSVTFWSAMLAAMRIAKDVPPFIPTAKGVLAHLQRSDLFFLASVGPDTAPLSATDFLANLADTMLDYFGELNEHAIKENFITVYELLDELLDSGFPLTVEPNILKQLVPPPTYLTKVIGTVTGDSTSGATKLPFPSASPLTPWRRDNVKYAQNEIFVDVCETVDAMFSANSNASSTAATFAPKIRHALIRGDILVNCRLSGSPDITMSLKSSVPLDDTSFHRCVRQSVFQDSGQLSYVPPDGRFTLMSYTVRDHRAFSLPIELDSSIRFDPASGSGAVAISVRPRFVQPVNPYAASTPGAGGAGGFGSSLMSTASMPSSGGAGMSHVTNTPPLNVGAGPGGGGNVASSVGNSGSMMLAQVMAAGGRITGPAEKARESNSMEDVEVTIPFGRSVAGASLSCNVGTVEFDSSTGTSRWIVGNVARGVTPTLSGSLSLAPDASPTTPLVRAAFKIPGVAVSGLFVDRMDIGPSVSYKYFKGLKCVTRGERYELRP